MAELKKELGVVRLTFYGVGTVVGAGIYTVLGQRLDGQDITFSSSGS